MASNLVRGVVAVDEPTPRQQSVPNWTVVLRQKGAKRPKRVGTVGREGGFSLYVYSREKGDVAEQVLLVKGEPVLEDGKIKLVLSVTEVSGDDEEELLERRRNA